MTARRESLWTIAELEARAALALSANYDGQANGRVRDVPDRRTIRYYTTLGLIDRPAAMLGRTALYGRRHLLQLVAIKRLQARGRSLAELQQELVGIPDAVLEGLARLPAGLEREADLTPAQAEPGRRAEAFWKELPASLPESAGNQAQPAMLPLQGIPLDEGVLLLLSPAREIHDDDLEAVRAVAAPLLKLLEKRRLVQPRQERRAP